MVSEGIENTCSSVFGASMMLGGWIPHLDPVTCDCILSDIASVVDGSTITSDNGFGLYSFEYCKGVDDVITTVTVRFDSRGMILMKADPGSGDERSFEVMKDLFLRIWGAVGSHASVDNACWDGSDRSTYTIIPDGDWHDGVAGVFDNLICRIRGMMIEMSNHFSHLDMENDIDSDLEYLIYGQYRKAICSIAYAMNYVGLFMDDSKERCFESLESYRVAIDSIYNSYCGFDVHRLNTAISETNDRIAEQNEASSRLARMVGLCTLLSTLTAVWGTLIHR